MMYRRCPRGPMGGRDARQTADKMPPLPIKGNAN